MPKLALGQELEVIERQYLYNLFFLHYLRDIRTTVSTWHEETILINKTHARSPNRQKEHIHVFCRFARSPNAVQEHFNRFSAFTRSRERVEGPWIFTS